MTVTREQVVGAVVYGQFVPEESTDPPTPVTGDVAVPASAPEGAFVGVPTSASDSASASVPDGVAAPVSEAVAVPGGADGVLVDAAGNPLDESKFLVRLDNFTGPFDLLLQLIGKHKLDVTEVALHQVTDDFIAYIRAMGDDWDLDETSEFLLVAATLLDLKAARLLPAADVEDEEDLALLEARDLLFARLLQYKAYKEAAAHIMELEVNGMRRWPRAVSMEPRYAEALPELVLGVGPERLFKLALKQFVPKPGPPQVSIAHIHQVRVSVREHATLLRDRLRRAGQATFSLLVADCENTLEVVARFLALLELYREGLIDFEQPVSLDELTVRWIGGDATDADLDIDDYEGSKPDPAAEADFDAAVAAEAELEAAAAEPDEDEPDAIADPDDFDAAVDEWDARAGELQAVIRASVDAGYPVASPVDESHDASDSSEDQDAVASDALNAVANEPGSGPLNVVAGDPVAGQFDVAADEWSAERGEALSAGDSDVAAGGLGAELGSFSAGKPDVAAGGSGTGWGESLSVGESDVALGGLGDERGESLSTGESDVAAGGLGAGRGGSLSAGESDGAAGGWGTGRGEPLSVGESDSPASGRGTERGDSLSAGESDGAGGGSGAERGESFSAGESDVAADGLGAGRGESLSGGGFDSAADEWDTDPDESLSAGEVHADGDQVGLGGVESDSAWGGAGVTKGAVGGFEGGVSARSGNPGADVRLDAGPALDDLGGVDDDAEERS